MRSFVQVLDVGSRAVSYMLGGLVVVLSVVVVSTSMSAADVAAWASRIFGFAFIGIMAGLIFVTLFCWVRVARTPNHKLWLETGLQAANGITTLALTFTLLGISLGIGTLADQQLTPETVQVVVRDLTGKFSLAFMTTVVGLPVSAVLRTLLLVTNAHRQESCATISSP